MTKRLFRLQEAYTVGLNLANKVRKDIPNGYAAGSDADLGILAQCIYNSGDGDYIEIGTLFGGSAILAALIKDRFNLGGRVFCVDPLDGYYGEGNKVAGIVPTAKVVLENAEHFNVSDRLTLIEKVSIPWPEELHERRFSCGYIDGDHWGDAPLQDWNSLNSRTLEYIVFDNYDIEHPDVVRACLRASQNPNWTPVYLGGISFVLQNGVMFRNPHKWAGGNYAA